MKKIGIVGGVAWVSTVEYYKTICQLSQRYQLGQAFQGPTPMPEMSIESVNLNESFQRQGVGGDEASWSRFDAYFHAALKRLEASGVDFAIIASNTPHNRYEAITRGIRIPVISIFEVVAKECARQGVQKILILGTKPTMNSPAFSVVLKKYGISAMVPQSEHDKSIVIKLITELQAGQGHDASRQIHDLVEKAFSSAPDVRKVACLACTELPLAFAEFTDLPTFEVDGVLYVNTTVIHAKAAFDYAVADNDR